MPVSSAKLTRIGNLRGIISDLRPSMLDDLGLLPAIEAMLDRRRDAGIAITSELALSDTQSDTVELTPDLETAIYRIVQEALTNVASHSRAESARVSAVLCGGEVLIDIEDDGVGFDIEATTAGFALAGTRERAYLAGGQTRDRIDPSGHGRPCPVARPADRR
jgi:signal transduction histidine kinase